MKNRKLLTLVAAALLVVVAGCGKNAGEEPKAGAASPSGTNPSAASTDKKEATGTSTGAAANNTPAQQTQQPKQEAPKTFEKVNVGPLKPGESAKIGPLTVTLKQTGVVDKATGLPQGYIHLMTELTIRNEAAEPYTINVTDHFKLDTPEGKKAPYNIQATANRTPRLQGTVEQGKEISGWIGYLAKKVPGKYKYQFIHPDWGTVTWEFAVQ
jgi:hypothetical protein